MKPRVRKHRGHDRFTQDEPMTQDYGEIKGPTGMPIYNMPPDEAKYQLSWWQRETTTTTAAPPWWKFWASPEDVTTSRWVRRAYPIDSELGQYLIEGSERRALNLIKHLFGDRPLFGCELEETGNPATTYTYTTATF